MDKITINQPVSVNGKPAKGKAVIVETLKEVFWTIYRKDADIPEFKKELNKVFSEDVISIMFTSMQIYADEFRGIQKTTKEQDDKYMSNAVNKVADSIIATHAYLIDSFFQEVKTEVKN